MYHSYSLYESKEDSDVILSLRDNKHDNDDRRVRHALRTRLRERSK